MLHIGAMADYTRYSFSITEDSVYCIDMIGGRGLSVKNEQVFLNDLDVENVLEHLKNIQIIISSNPTIDKIFKFTRMSDTLTISETGKASFEIIYPKGFASYNAGVLSATKKFNIHEVQRLLVRAFDNIRLISDIGYGIGENIIVDRQNDVIILRIPSTDTKVVSMFSNCDSNVIYNCLVNGKCVPAVLLQTDQITGRVEVYDVVNATSYGYIPYTSDVFKVFNAVPGFIPHMINTQYRGFNDE